MKRPTVGFAESIRFSKERKPPETLGVYAFDNARLLEMIAGGVFDNYPDKQKEFLVRSLGLSGIGDELGHNFRLTSPLFYVDREQAGAMVRVERKTAFSGIVRGVSVLVDKTREDRAYTLLELGNVGFRWLGEEVAPPRSAAMTFSCRSEITDNGVHIPLSLVSQDGFKRL